MRKIFIVLFIFVTVFSFLTFHDKGNGLLKPYFVKYLHSKLIDDIRVEVMHLKIDWNHIEFKALLDEKKHLNVEGKFSFFTSTLDLNYRIESDDLKNKININGTVRGTFNNLAIHGVGDIVHSKVNYTFNLKDDLFSHIKVNIDKADIASFLALIKQEPYATGQADINVDIKNLERQTISAKPQILLSGVVLNEKIFKQKLQIDLPPQTVLTAKFNARFLAKAFQLNGVVKSDFATLELSKSYYNRRTKELSSKYRLIIPRLSKLTTQQKLRGGLEVIGTFQGQKAKICLTGRSENLGGRMVFNLKGNRLNAHMNGVDMGKLLLLFNKKTYVSGKIMADIELNDFKNLKGTFNLKTKEAKSIDSTLKKELHLDFGENLYFSLNAKGKISSKIITMEAKFDSDILNYSSSNIKYHLSKKAVNSTYLLHIAKLSKLNFLTGKTLRGELSINGELNYQNELLMTGRSTNFGGNIDFSVKADKLKAKIKNVSVVKLMKVLDYPQLFKAKLMGNFDYDFTRSAGRFNSILNEAELLNTYLIKVIKDIRGVDLRNKHYGHTYFNATFRKNIVDINFKAQSKSVLLSILSGQINKVSNEVNAYYKLKVDNKSLEGRIIGDITNPKVTFDSSKYIQNNIMSIIKENMNPSSMRNHLMDRFFR